MTPPPPRLLVFQHVAGEHPARFAGLWAADGIAWDVVAFDDGGVIPERLDRYQGMVVLGGPMDVWEETAHPWLVAEKAAIRQFVAELGRPFLGICLGHQLLASALGGTVAPMARPELGIMPVELTPDGGADTLFAGLGPAPVTLQWHAAEVVVPAAGSAILARSAGCAVQALRWGRHAWGVQFHPEVTAASVAEFQAAAADRAFVERQLGPGASGRLAADILAALPALERAAVALHAGFRGHLPSAELTGGEARP